MPGKVRAASPEVITYAEEHRIDMTQLTGTGEGGRITHDDVFLARVADKIGLPPSASVTQVLAGVEVVVAQKRRRDEQAAASARAAVAAAEATVAMRGSLPLTAARAAAAARGPAYAMNPLVDQVRTLAASGQGTAAPVTSAPTLFTSGDLPTFTASGIPPEALLDVPWQARHAMAAAATSAEAYAVVGECTGPDAATSAEMQFGTHPGNSDYAHRVDRWRLSAMTDSELHDSLIPGAREEAARREQERNAQPLPAGDEAMVAAEVHRLTGWGRRD